MTCDICHHQIDRLTSELYRRYGIHDRVMDYPQGHFERTRELVTQLFEHIGQTELDEEAEQFAGKIRVKHL